MVANVNRREFPRAVKRAAYKRANGHCEKCTAELYTGKFHYDHDNPNAMTGEPTLENCVVLCLACHKVKTTTVDVPRIAKAKRNEARHIGAERPKKAWPKRSFQQQWRA